MSDSPADSVMAAPNPPGRGGACGAVNTPAPLFYSARHEQRAAEQEQRVGDRWTTTGKADAATDHQPRAIADGGLDRVPASADAAKPTFSHPLRRSPFWKWA